MVDAAVCRQILTACLYVDSVTENPRISPSARSETENLSCIANKIEVAQEYCEVQL